MEKAKVDTKELNNNNMLGQKQKLQKSLCLTLKKWQQRAWMKKRKRLKKEKNKGVHDDGGIQYYKLALYAIVVAGIAICYYIGRKQQ